MAKLDPEVFRHLEWLGFVRPVGLVVSAPALVRAGAILNRRDIDGQKLLQECVNQTPFGTREETAPCLPDFRQFAEKVLGWNFVSKAIAGTTENPIPEDLQTHLIEYQQMLKPHWAVRELDPENGKPPWQLLVNVAERDIEFDQVSRDNGQLEASAHGRLERLLRQTGVSAGLLFNGTVIRLVSAPRGENSGWIDFRVSEMVQTSGRPIVAALRLLLSEERLLSLPRPQRLPALLEDSRKFQNEVSERLAEQVLHALYELLRGFQAAHDGSKGTLLRKPLAENPDVIYRALLTVILRLVFLLFAEERDMLPDDGTFLRYYSLAGLFNRLRDDAALYPDTMDQRYGAWAQLLVLFRMVHDGAVADSMHLPKRHGVLFDPERFPFLEGREKGDAWSRGDRLEAPLVPDGTIYRALEKLLILDGERISYRALDVEQIGSVYETMMGFRLEITKGRAVAIKAVKKHGAPTAISVEDLLAEPSEKRGKWLLEQTGRKITDNVGRTVEQSKRIEELHAALLPVIDRAATPDLLPKGAMVLQPSEERRRSGSHYTPRALTEPIVRTTLQPILDRLKGPTGQPPRADQILDLKVCDPAMGSGAFLVEACRQLGDAMLESWRVHGGKPAIPADEDEVVYARRLVAQRCLYGVDRNPVAVDLAKVSLWLITLAREHPLTFLDHALRHGDSLVGLTLKQIEALHWDSEKTLPRAGFETTRIRDSLSKASALRRQIRNSDDNTPEDDLRKLWEEVQATLTEIRLLGDLVIDAFIEGETAKQREVKRNAYANDIVNGTASKYAEYLKVKRFVTHPLAPFHWEVEFTEVFERENPGFDAIIGNPPFLGSKELGMALPPGQLDFIKMVIGQIKGKTDLAAYFFRRAWSMIRKGGTFGLIATNTIAQGDTHASGLLVIYRQGGVIYSADKRLRWPGKAAVVVSVIHIIKKADFSHFCLNGLPVDRISTYLLEKGPSEPPVILQANQMISGKGIIHGGDGFVFEGEGKDGFWPLSLAHSLREDPKMKLIIRPFWGSHEINNSPDFLPLRFVINFGELPEATVKADFPAIYEMVSERVKPERMKLKNQSGAESARKFWWRFTYRADGLLKTLAKRQTMLALGRVSEWLSFCRLPSSDIPSEAAVAIALDSYAAFCILQARPHEIWARFFGSSMKDDLRYTPSDCFQTFPFPEKWETHPALETVGKDYYEFRAGLMIRNNEGLTKTYNRFHDPEERDPDIVKLRALHAAMDRTVLNAYGWTDIPTECEFILDYNIDEETWGDKKKPWRYRWPDAVRDEVLARLLELNAERAKQEALSAPPAKTRIKQKATKKVSQKDSQTRELF